MVAETNLSINSLRYSDTVFGVKSSDTTNFSPRLNSGTSSKTEINSSTPLRGRKPELVTNPFGIIVPKLRIRTVAAPPTTRPPSTV